jgi:predicted TIM-barrel fold metal-dependent hydrolase
MNAVSPVIDIHHHITPPAWLEADTSPTTAMFRGWSPQMSLDEMTLAGVDMAIGAVGGFHAALLERNTAVTVARQCNEYAAELMARHPKRFGAFGILPLPYAEESVGEIDRVLDDTGLDGFELLTSYRDKWLGHPDFEPVLARLNERKAVVHVHPAAWDYTSKLLPDAPLAAMLSLELGMDTARAIFSLIFSGTATRYPDIQFVFSHGGGTVVSLLERLELQIPAILPFGEGHDRASVQAILKRFNYDTAQVLNSATIGYVLDYFPTSQLVFGSDSPFRSIAEHKAGLQAATRTPATASIASDNAFRLFPRLRGVFA